MGGFNNVPCSVIRSGAVVRENFAIFADSHVSGFIIRNLHVKLGRPIEVVRCLWILTLLGVLGVNGRCCSTMSIRLNPIYFHAPFSWGSPIAIVQTHVEVVRCKGLWGNRKQICVDTAINIAQIHVEFNKATIQVECRLCCCTASSLNFPASVEEQRSTVCDG